MSYVVFVPVQTSRWPLLISFSVFSFLTNIVFYFHYKASLYLVLVCRLFLVLVSFMWWKDVVRERVIGYHSHKLEARIRFGMLLFILSEVFFFVSFFWAFFDASLAPVVDIGILWPPKGISPLSMYSVPLLNTIILLARGVTVTWAHHSIISNSFTKSVLSLFLTISLGVYFLLLQYIEYCEAQFAIRDGAYGTTFFVSTGFHGIHVIIGTLFLIYSFILLIKGKLISNHHVTFELARWYWHFVDVVWLYLFVIVYGWSSIGVI